MRAFLKVIDEFTYDHSERLGDAFEYLLSVLGSQGDAGQFRTPRHIIDFIVSVVDPKKDETILDPACGTAGFLISSYKHILKSNIDDEGNSTLTPDEKGTLAANFKGYDISPDMVRLSLVNLYLHGFVDPHIAEYDTLTSEERWNEYADVILANPPFMSSKGGIRPHRRFSVQSKRSEVLFVDYMAEHLTPTGRAGIIVPEGIVFQSQTAYKQLRKMLVENYLVAVISLPAGVFQPYSGVKTSILLLDKALANKTDRIAFFKVENDGFGLGAQRREIAENDLPQVKEELGEYLGRLRAGESVPSDGVAESRVEYTATLGLIAEKEKIAVGGEYNLSGERYRESGVRRKTKWPMVELGSVIRILNGYAFKSKNYVTDGIRVIRITNVQRGRIVDNDPKFYPKASEKSISKYMLNENDLLLSLTGNVGRIGILNAYYLPAALNQRVACLRPDNDKALTAYIFYLLNHNSFEDSCIGRCCRVRVLKCGSPNWFVTSKKHVESPKYRAVRPRSSRMYRVKNCVVRAFGLASIWLDDSLWKQWYNQGPSQCSVCLFGSNDEWILTMRVLLRLPLRQTQGFIQSLLDLMQLDLATPDYSTLSRRQGSLAVKSRPIARMPDALRSMATSGKSVNTAGPNGGRGANCMCHEATGEVVAQTFAA